MANPAEGLVETSQTRFPSRNGGEANKVNNYLKVLQDQQWHKAIIKSVSSDYNQKYTVDIYGDGYTQPPTVKGVEAINVNPIALAGTWSKGAPAYIRMLDTGQAVFVPDDILYYLYLTKKWEPEDNNTLIGKVTDEAGGEPDGSITDQIKITIHHPFESSINLESLPIPNLVGAYKRFLTGNHIPFKKYQSDFKLPGDPNTIVVGMAINFSILPAPKGRFTILMQMDDDEGNVDFDKLRFP